MTVYVAVTSEYNYLPKATAFATKEEAAEWALEKLMNGPYHPGRLTGLFRDFGNGRVWVAQNPDLTCEAWVDAVTLGDDSDL